MGMKILIAGGGGREHALEWKIKQSPHVDIVYIASGNGGTENNLNIKADDIGGILNFAKKEKIDLTVVGPEAPLVAGISNLFKENGLYTVGPSQAASMLEGSKIISKDIMTKYNVPTAEYKIVSTMDQGIEAGKYFLNRDDGVVAKFDGLAGGKGVMLCKDERELNSALEIMLIEQRFGKGDVLMEQLLRGEELSYIAICDGENIIPFAASQDHKAILDGDRGDNTGGMGAYSPVSMMSAILEKKIIDKVMRPTVRGMAEEGNPYRGFLYAGLMIINGNPYVLEFNCRLGDPETQPLLMRMKSDIVPYLMGSAKGDLSSLDQIEWDERAACCVVMAAGGYPHSYEKGKLITGLDAVKAMNDVMVFHAGTKRGDDNKIFTSGGRVLGVTALGHGQQAVDLAYEAAAKISWENEYHRTDIGKSNPNNNRTGLR